MPSPVTYGRLRKVLRDLGFKETRREDGVSLKHPESDTLFMFRPYQDGDRLQFGELSFVRKQLDLRGLLEPESFEALLEQAPAG